MIPIIVLVVLLMLRLFTFYLEILTTGIREHRKAIEEWGSYRGFGFMKYENTAEITMVKGGILGIDLSKKYVIEAYLYNEDKLVRGKYLVEKVE